LANGFGYLLYTNYLILNSAKNLNVHQYDYKTICRVLKDRSWTKGFDLTLKVPFAYNNDTWISYDNYVSYQIKTDIIKQKNINGAFTSFINSDDSCGLCGDEKYPITKYLKKQFKQKYD